MLVLYLNNPNILIIMSIAAPYILICFNNPHPKISFNKPANLTPPFKSCCLIISILA